MNKQRALSMIMPIVIGIILVVPVFVSFSGSPHLAPEYSSDVAAAAVVPLSWLLGPVVIAFLLLSRRLKFYEVDFLLLVFVIGGTLSLFSGLVFNGASYMPESESVVLVRFAQTISPLLWFFIPRLLVGGYSFGRMSESVRLFYLTISVVLVISLVGYLIQTLLDGGSSFRFSLLSPHIGPFYNFKAKRFFPILLSIMVIMQAVPIIYSGYKKAGSALSLLAITLGLIGILGSWSRTALLCLLIGLVVGIFKSIRCGKKSALYRVAALSIALVVCVLIAVPYLGSLAPQSISRITNTVDAISSGDADISDSDTRRFDRMEAGFVHGVLSPTGDQYRIRRDQFGAGDRQLLITENGFLDSAVRTGTIGFVAFITLLYICVKYLNRITNRCLNISKALSSYRHSSETTICLFSILIGVVFVGNMFLNLASEPYVSPVLWVTLGFIIELNRSYDYGIDSLGYMSAY